MIDRRTLLKVIVAGGVSALLGPLREIPAEQVGNSAGGPTPEPERQLLEARVQIDADLLELHCEGDDDPRRRMDYIASCVLPYQEAAQQRFKRPLDRCRVQIGRCRDIERFEDGVYWTEHVFVPTEEFDGSHLDWAWEREALPFRKERFEWNMDPKPIRDEVRRLNAGRLRP